MDVPSLGTPGGQCDARGAKTTGTRFRVDWSKQGYRFYILEGNQEKVQKMHHLIFKFSLDSSLEKTLEPVKSKVPLLILV